MRSAARLADAIDRAPRPPRKIRKLELYRHAKALRIWDAFETWLQADAEREAEWNLAVEIWIDDPLTIEAQKAMGMTDAELDTFFREAAKL